MSDEKLLTIREVAQLLGVSEKEVIDCAESGAIPAYKIGGVYLRFKRHEVESFRKRREPVVQAVEHYSAQERLSDFFYYYDFYILAALIIGIVLVFIFRW